jgi:hypothetical protein
MGGLLSFVGLWLFGRAAGIDADEAEPGYRRLLNRLIPVGSLSCAEAALEFPVCTNMHINSMNMLV